MNNNPPSGNPPSGAPGDAPGGSSSFSGTRSASTEIAVDTEFSNSSYSSVTGGENALLVTDGNVSLTDLTVTKSGDESSESSDFYGTNAAVLSTGGSLTIDGGTITTSGAHANGVFAYGDGNIVVKNTTIKTSNNNSGAIMVTGGGTLTAENVTAETSGNSSAPIRSDRGGGTMTISGGSFTSNGVGSPAIYSTANVSVSGATLTSNASEGVVIEGSNSVSLTNVVLVDTNNQLNGNSETYKNIFIYQSMSGDAEEGTGTFSAQGSSITTNQGDTFYITNTTANIELENNQFINNDSASAFLRAAGAKWGTSGQNGGHVNLKLVNQVAEGDIILDNLSTLNLVLSDQSYYMGAINMANSASSVSVTLDKTSNLILAGDSYIASLENADSSNQNIYSNGYKLYVAGTEVEVNGSKIPEAPEVNLETESATVESATTVATETKKEIPMVAIIVAIVSVVVIVAACLILYFRNKKKHQLPPTPPATTPENPFHPSDGGTGVNIPEGPLPPAN